MSTDRIYVVTQGDINRLIKARTVTGARAFAAIDIKGRLASQDDLISMLAAGVEIEDSANPVDINQKDIPE